MSSPYADLFKQLYGTSLLADAAFRAGVEMRALGRLAPLERLMKMAGPVVTVEANNDLISIMDALDQAAPGDVLAIAGSGGEVALIGDLIGTEARRKGLAGFVIDGRVRDTTELVDLGVPVFCAGSHPMGPLKLTPEEKGIGVLGGSLTIRGVSITPGMWVFGDADGLIFLDSGTLEQVFEQAAIAHERESDLVSRIASGTALADALQLGLFVQKRIEDPDADFNDHLNEIGEAI